MNRQVEQTQEAARREAVGWLLRLDGPDAAEADWLAFQAWLEAAPEHRDAFEAVDRVSAELAECASDLLCSLDSRKLAGARRPLRFGRHTQRWARAWPAASALAAAAAALIVFIAVRPPAPAPSEVYQTAKGENRMLNLADGSHIRLNSGSRIAVRLERGARYVEMTEGEAAFDVAKDPNRPFLIAAGERTIRVVGTEFDVLRHQGLLRVTVRRGVVAVQSSDAEAQSEPVLLKVGDQLEHQTGDQISTVQRVDPDAAFAWRDGELIYRNQPLADVVEDLNRYYAVPVRVDGPASALRFSGVLKIDAEEDVVRRLQGFLRLSAEHRSDGFILRQTATAR
jgi:transmembrane sensor